MIMDDWTLAGIMVFQTQPDMVLSAERVVSRHFV